MSKSNYGVVKPSLCPSCGYLMDCASDPLGGDFTPKPGDVSMCLNCGEVLTFQEDLSMAKATEEDIKLLGPENVALMLKMREIRQAAFGDRLHEDNGTAQ